MSEFRRDKFRYGAVSRPGEFTFSRNCAELRRSAGISREHPTDAELKEVTKAELQDDVGLPCRVKFRERQNELLLRDAEPYRLKSAECSILDIISTLSLQRGKII